MSQQGELDVQRVLHLVELLCPPDHIRHHHFRLGPRKVLVNCVTVSVEFVGEVVGEAQQLCETDSRGSRVLLLDFESSSDCVDVVGGDNHLPFFKIFQNLLVTADIIFSGGSKEIHNGIFIAVKFSQSCLLDYIGPAD